MEFTYENQGTHTFLVCKVGESDTVDTMSIGMLTNNKIPGLAHTLFMQVDADRYIKYDISAKTPVKRFFDGQVNKRQLLGVLNGIVDAMMAAEEYMLDVNSISLDLEYIFTDVSTCETVLICLPFLETSGAACDLGAFFKNIMTNTRFDASEGTDYVGKIIIHLNNSPIFSLEEFKNLLETLSASAPNSAPSGVVVESREQRVQPEVKINPTPVVEEPRRPSVPVVQPVREVPQPQTEKPAVEEKKAGLFSWTKKRPSTKEPRKKDEPRKTKKNMDEDFAIPGQTPTLEEEISRPEMPAAQTGGKQPDINAASVTKEAKPEMHQRPMDFGNTVNLQEINKGLTTVLSQSVSTALDPHLVRVKNNEKIRLNKPVFRIGKEKSYVDYFIGDNSAISRSHADIVTRDGQYYVVDINSTNHTYVNGGMIQSNVEVRIDHGTKLRFANEEFEFKLR